MKKTKLFACLTSFGFLISLGATVTQASNLKIENFDSNSQDGALTCWAAVSSMVLQSTYHRSEKECAVVSQYQGAQCCAFIGGVKAECDKRGDVANALATYGVKTTVVAPSLSAIENSIRNGRLPVLHLALNGQPGLSHVAVVAEVYNIEDGASARLRIFDPESGWDTLTYGELVAGYRNMRLSKIILPQ